MKKFAPNTKKSEGPSEKQLTQSVRIGPRLDIPDDALVFAVAKPFANPEIFSAKQNSHVPLCEAQHMVQKLQGLVACIYYNAWVRLKREFQNEQQPSMLRGIEVTPMWQWKSAHFFIADETRVAGCLDLLLYMPNPQMRLKAFNLNYSQIALPDFIVKLLSPAKKKKKDRPSAEEKEPVPEAKSMSESARAAFILSLTPFEIINYLMQNDDLEPFDMDGALASLTYLQHRNFGNLRHYYRYCGLPASDDYPNPEVLFSAPNAALILFNRCCSYISTADRHLIKSAPEFLHYLFNNGEKPPSADKVREAHNKRAEYLSRPMEDIDPNVASALRAAIESLYMTFVQECTDYGKRAAKFLEDMPPLRVNLLTQCIRDYLPDLPLTLGDPAHLMRVFSDKPVERKTMVVMAREDFHKKVVNPLLARYRNAHVNKEANQQYTRVKEALLATALTLFTEEYERPVEDCHMVFGAISGLVFPKMGVMPVLPTFDRLETQSMTAVDNVMMALYEEGKRLKLDAYAPDFMRLATLMMVAPSLLFTQDRKNWVLQGGPAGGKSYLLKLVNSVMQGKSNLMTAVTEAAIKNGVDGILALAFDEGDVLNCGEPPSVKELLSRFGQFFKLKNGKNTSAMKGSVTAQHREYQTAEHKDKDGVHHTGYKCTSHSADNFATSNYPPQTSGDAAMFTRANALPFHVLGNLENSSAIEPSESTSQDETFFKFNMLCVMMYHFRACGLFNPPESETAHFAVDQVVVSLTRRGFNIFESLFEAVDQSLEGDPLQRAYPKAQLQTISSNLLRASADMLAFSQENVATGDKIHDYNSARKRLQSIVEQIHTGVSTPPMELSDGSSLFSQRDVRHFKHLYQVMAYVSAIASVFNGNAACGNFTQGDFFDRTLLLENAVESEVQHLLKALEVTNWQDERLIDAKLSLLALYIMESQDRHTSLLLPDDNGVILIPGFFESKPANMERWRFFMNKLKRAFDPVIWDQDARIFVFLFTFLRVAGSQHPLLFVSDFDEESKDSGLHMDVRVFLYGELTACFNGAISALQTPVTTLAFTPELNYDSNRGGYTRVPAAVTLGARHPTIADNKSLWSQPVTRDRLFNRPTDEGEVEVEDVVSPPLVHMIRSMSIDTEPERSRKRSAGFEDNDGRAQKQYVVFQQDQGDGARKVPPVVLPAECDRILQQVMERNNVVSVNIFFRLFQIGKEPQVSKTASQDTTAAIAWYWDAAKLSWNPQSRRAFLDKIKDVQQQLIRKHVQRMGVVNETAREDAVKFSQLSARHIASCPVTLMRIIDNNGPLEYPRKVDFWAPRVARSWAVTPVPIRSYWVNLFMKRCTNGHNIMRHSALVRQSEFQADMELPHLEREERLEKMTGIKSHLYCLSQENKKASQGFKARIYALVQQLRPLFQFEAPFTDEHGVFFFQQIIPPETVSGVHVGPVTIYTDDRKKVTTERTPVGVYKGLLVDCLVEFFKFMDWWNHRTGLLTPMIDRNTCHYWAHCLGLKCCSSVIDQIADNIFDYDAEEVKEIATQWVDEVVCETQEDRDERWKALTDDLTYVEALEERGLFPSDICLSVFLPDKGDLPLTTEQIAQKFGLFPVLTPRVI